MRPPPLLLLALCCAPLSAADLKTIDGRTIAYDTIDCDPARPKTAFVLKGTGSVVSLKLSDVDPAALPADLRQRIAEHATAQQAKGLILYQDEWIDRDGHLLKTDPRFAYERKLVPAGRNRFVLVNGGAERVTIGIRPLPGMGASEKTRGYEVSVEPGRSRTIQLPDGSFRVLVVVPSSDDSELGVGEGANVTLANTHYTLTTGQKDGMQVKPLGTIVVPPAMRRAP